MPQANVWIKKENWDAWNALEDKSKAVNLMIEEEYYKLHAPQPLNKENKDYSNCKHGKIKGFCKLGCK